MFKSSKTDIFVVAGLLTSDDEAFRWI